MHRGSSRQLYSSAYPYTDILTSLPIRLLLDQQSYSIASLASPIRPHIEMNREIVKAALSYGFRVRANLHMVVECPFEGPVPPERVADIAQELVEMGVYEVSLGDTTGRGDPATIRRLIEAVAPRIGVERIAGHVSYVSIVTFLAFETRTDSTCCQQVP
jgi:hypothetical protein